MTDTTTPADERTRDAIKKCAEWLADCVRAGWDKGSLDALESLWWEHHDGQGNLQARAASQPAQDPSTEFPLLPDHWLRKPLDPVPVVVAPAAEVQQEIRLAKLRAFGEGVDAKAASQPAQEPVAWAIYWTRQDRIMELADLYANAVNEAESSYDWQDARAALEREVRKPA